MRTLAGRPALVVGGASTTGLGNLIRLCGAHHRALHNGDFTVQTLAPGRFVFRARAGWVIGQTTPDGRAEPQEIIERNQDLGLQIDWETCRPRWLGERCDYSVAIDRMIPRSRSEPVPAQCVAGSSVGAAAPPDTS